MIVSVALQQRLRELVDGRRTAAEHLVAAVRRAGAAGMLAVGSQATRSGDPFSDVDLLVIHHGTDVSIDIERLAGRPILAATYDPRPRPTGIAMSAIGVGAATAITWLKVFQWPAAFAQVPADSLILYDTLALPYSHHRFEQVLRRYGPHPTGDTCPAAELRQIAADAKVLARGRTAAATQRRDDQRALGTADRLRNDLYEIDAARLGAAVTCTAHLIDLAEAVRASGWCDSGQVWPPQPHPHGRYPPTARRVPARSAAPSNE